MMEYNLVAAHLRFPCLFRYFPSDHQILGERTGIDGNDFGHRLTSQGLTETRETAAILTGEKLLMRYTSFGIFISPRLTRTELPLTRIPVTTLSERSASTSRRLGRPISTP